MSVAEKQRSALVASKGEPAMTLEFDVWSDGNVSMWTHLNHSGDYEETKKRFMKIRDHIDSFMSDGTMCPFCPKT